MTTQILLNEPVLVLGPQAPAVEVWEVAEQLRLGDSHDEDALIERKIAAKTQEAEQYAGIAIITQTWQLSLAGFPSGPIWFPIRPLQGVVSIEYGSGSIDTTTIGGLYTVKGVGAQMTFGSIAPASGQSWPSTATNVLVTFTVGFGDTSESVPPLIRDAIVVMVATSFDQRLDAESTELPLASRLMLGHWRRPAVA
jgi:uncharacterized phiE125 gp8 family phage protein